MPCFHHWDQNGTGVEKKESSEEIQKDLVHGVGGVGVGVEVEEADDGDGPEQVQHLPSFKRATVPVQGDEVT